ncbi:MAG: hypothetical protein ACJ74M_03145 [Gaiellaceae bacterium]|jgi:hypothetical protein
MRLELEQRVRCSDGDFGELMDVVVDPVAKELTHLVVRPDGGDGVARLVPTDLVENSVDGKEIRLRCSSDDVRALDYVQEFAFLRFGDVPTSDANWDVGVQDVLAYPYYESPEVMGYGASFDAGGVTYDRVPKGEVEIRRSSIVTAADDDVLGKVDGFVVDGAHITHFVLERGHLWGKREITIPIGAVAKVETDSVALKLSKDEVGDLPSVRVHRWH